MRRRPLLHRIEAVMIDLVFRELLVDRRQTRLQLGLLVRQKGRKRMGINLDMPLLIELDVASQDVLGELGGA